MGSKNQARNATRYHFQKQGGKCFYCDTEMYLMADSDKKYRKLHRPQLATFDHIKLAEDGGTHARDNGVCACFRCNGIRGNLPQDVFIKHFDFVVSEWDKGNRSAYIKDGQIFTISSKKFKRIKRTRRKKADTTAKAAFIICRYAEQIGKTVEDLFLEYVYNSTYEQLELSQDYYNDTHSKQI